MKNQAKRKRDALKARTLAAIDTDRAERCYRRQVARFDQALRDRNPNLLGLMIERIAEADRLWMETRRRGLMVEVVCGFGR